MFEAPAGEKLTDPENELAVRHALAEAESSKDVSQVVDPYEAKTITKDGRIAYADVIYPVPSGEIDDQARDELGESGKPAEEAGITVEYGGGLVTDTEEANPRESAWWSPTSCWRSRLRRCWPRACRC